MADTPRELAVLDAADRRVPERIEGHHHLRRVVLTFPAEGIPPESPQSTAPLSSSSTTAAASPSKFRRLRSPRDSLRTQDSPSSSPLPPRQLVQAGKAGSRRIAPPPPEAPPPRFVAVAASSTSPSPFHVLVVSLPSLLAFSPPPPSRASAFHAAVRHRSPLSVEREAPGVDAGVFRILYRNKKRVLDSATPARNTTGIEPETFPDLFSAGEKSGNFRTGNRISNTDV